MISTLSESFRSFQYDNIWLVVICVIVNLTTLYAIYCYREFARRHPRNLIFLFIFTITEAYLTSFLCNTVKPTVVLLTGLLTFGLVAALTIYAYKS